MHLERAMTEDKQGHALLEPCCQLVRPTIEKRLISSSERDETSSAGIPDAFRESREMEKMSNFLLRSSESKGLLLPVRLHDCNNFSRCYKRWSIVANTAR
jgi:hypothetical protein